MDRPRTLGAPTLVVTSPGRDIGRRIVLSQDEVVVGRAESNDVRFDDPRVSRTHAVLRYRNGVVYLEDAGSSGGTFVNRQRVTSSRRLRPGDEIAFADVHLRFEGAADVAGETQPGGLSRSSIPDGGGRPAARYDIGEQRANMVNNVGRDQYVIQQRENFLREIAATKTKARYLIALGSLLFVIGFAMFASGILSFFSEIPSADGLDPSGDFSTPFGSKVFGVPLGVVGWAMGAAGTLLATVGIILHVVATSRRKRVDRELPYPGSYGHYR
jgi:FHA domain